MLINLNEGNEIKIGLLKNVKSFIFFNKDFAFFLK